MIKVLGTRKFPSGAQLTRLECVTPTERFVFHVRENARSGPNTDQLTQVLEVSVSEKHQAFVKLVVEAEDSLKRPVHFVDFEEWAGQQFASSATGDV